MKGGGGADDDRSTMPNKAPRWQTVPPPPAPDSTARSHAVCYLIGEAEFAVPGGGGVRCECVITEGFYRWCNSAKELPRRLSDVCGGGGGGGRGV